MYAVLMGVSESFVLIAEEALDCLLQQNTGVVTWA